VIKLVTRLQFDLRILLHLWLGAWCFFIYFWQDFTRQIAFKTFLLMLMPKSQFLSRIDLWKLEFLLVEILRCPCCLGHFAINEFNIIAHVLQVTTIWLDRLIEKLHVINAGDSHHGFRLLLLPLVVAVTIGLYNLLSSFLIASYIRCLYTCWHLEPVRIVDILLTFNGVLNPIVFSW